MENKSQSVNKVLANLSEAKEILQSQVFAAINDPDYPMAVDLMEISKAKSLMSEVEFLFPSTAYNQSINSNVSVEKMAEEGVDILIAALRKTDMYIEDIFMRGGCYRFHLFLKQIYPECQPYINNGKNHIVTKIGDRLYDIKGAVKKSDEWFYNPLTQEDLKNVRRWSFWRFNLLQLKECPYCEEPLCVPVNQHLNPHHL